MSDPSTEGAVKQMIWMYEHEEDSTIRATIDKCLKTIGYTAVRYGDRFAAIHISEMVFPNDVEEAK